MDNTNIIKCPYCGSVDKIININNHFKCGYCDCEFYTCSDEDRLLLNQAQGYLRRYKFDDADDIYKELSHRGYDNKDNELYVMAEWGRLLAYFGIVYIKSFSGGVSIPTIAKYDSRFLSVTENEHYNNIMDANIDNDMKEKYKHMAEALDEVYTRIKNELSKDTEYDVFLCVKISTKTEAEPNLDGYTKDSKIADTFYDELTKRGLKVFYSEKCCQGIEYDSQILSALTRSKMLLVIATRRDYLESAWVESEWRRWLSFISFGEKDRNSLILYLPSFNEAFSLPSVLTRKKLQYFDNSLNVINHLVETLNPTPREEPRVNYNNRSTYDDRPRVKEPDAHQLIILNECKKLIEQKKYKKAIDRLTNLAIDDVVEAERILGTCYLKGFGVDISYDKALDWYSKAADNNDVEAVEAIISMYKSGYIRKTNSEAVYKYLTKRAELSNDKDDIEAVLKYLRDNNIKDSKESFKYNLMLAKKNDVPSINDVAYSYLHGEGVEKNVADAKSWYQVAAKLNSTFAKEALANLYDDENSYKEAIKWYKEAALDNDPKAIYMLGYYYENGYGVEIDFNEAARLYKELAFSTTNAPKALRKRAISSLANFYRLGRGVKKNGIFYILLRIYLLFI